MEIIFNKIYKDLNLKKYGIDDSSCFLDIETTGLNRNRNNIYLIGIIYFDKYSNSWILNQIFADNLNNEREILLEAVEILEKHNVIINYNGSSFDIPFLNSRLEFYDVDYFIDKERSFDIYRMVKSNKKFLNLENLKLKTIEKYLGIDREDIYSGKDCIQFYYDYQTNKDEILKADILRHNMDDLIYMLDIISIIDVIKSNKSFNIEINEKGLSYEFCIEELNFEKKFLIARGNIDKRFFKTIVHYDMNYSIEIYDKSFVVSIETNTALTSTDKLGQFIYLNDFMDNPNNQALVLCVEKEIIIPNIKGLLEILIKKTI